MSSKEGPVLGRVPSDLGAVTDLSERGGRIVAETESGITMIVCHRGLPDEIVEEKEREVKRSRLIKALERKRRRSEMELEKEIAKKQTSMLWLDEASDVPADVWDWGVPDEPA
tara:strand:- start:142 stop:480 length:339 start_codon:yes stop_codon:yes gene_type:complete